MYLSADICTIPSNLSGDPAISVPCGLDSSGPVGFQVLARLGRGGDVPASPRPSSDFLDLPRALHWPPPRVRHDVGSRHRDRDPLETPGALQDVPAAARPSSAVSRIATCVRVASGFPVHCRYPMRRRSNGPSPLAWLSGCDRPALGVPPLELLLRRPSQELSDLAVRPPRSVGRSPRSRCRSGCASPRYHPGSPAEDTGKSTHLGGGGTHPRRRRHASRLQSIGYPVGRSGHEPRHSHPRRGPRLRPGLRSVVLALGISDARLERRVDAFRRQRFASAAAWGPFGTKVEVKNMNSLRSLASPSLTRSNGRERFSTAVP